LPIDLAGLPYREVPDEILAGLQTNAHDAIEFTIDGANTYIRLRMSTARDSGRHLPKKGDREVVLDRKERDGTEANMQQ
jgi:hypothetical protein